MPMTDAPHTYTRKMRLQMVRQASLKCRGKGVAGSVGKSASSDSRPSIQLRW